MSDNNNSVDHPVKQGKIGKFLSFIMRIVGVLFFSAFMSIIIEWIVMTTYYPDQGYSHAEGMLYRELGYFSGEELDIQKPEIFDQAERLNVGNLNTGARESANDFVNWIQTYFLGNNGVIIRIKDYMIAKPNDGVVTQEIKELIHDVYDYLIAAILISVMFCVRLSILFLSLPAFLMFGIVGLVDGLMQRDLRKWSGGNESAFIYHWAKRFALPILIIGWVVYLAIPTSIHPNYIITPCAIAFGLVLMVMASKFKKYL